jgi:3-dehydroquinate synthase
MMRQGLGEIFKISTIKGKQLFTKLISNIGKLEDINFYKTSEGIEILSDAIELMLEELHDNPRETNLRRCVDFGHSFCPLVEMESLKRAGSRTIPHGYAVAYDCALTTALSRNRQMIPVNHFKEIFGLYKSFDFDFGNGLYKDNNLLWASFLEMTKHRGFNQNLPVPIEIGNYTFLQDVTFDEMVSANDLLQSEMLT